MELSDLLGGGGRSRETKIRRDALFRWWNGDEVIDHPKVVRALAGWIDRAEDGRLCLANSINWAYVTIEGPAYAVRSVQLEPGGRVVRLRLSGEVEEPLDPTSLRRDEDGTLFADVRDGRVAARFDNHAALQLAELVDDDEHLVLDGVRYPIPTVTDPLAPRSPRRPTQEPLR